MKRDDRILLLQAIAGEVAERAHMRIPHLHVRRLKGRTAAYTEILSRNRIVVNELAPYALNGKEQAVMLAHEMGRLKYMWFWTVLATNLILVFSVVISIFLIGIPIDLPRFLFLFLWFLSSWTLPLSLEHIANHFAYRLYGKELGRKTLKDIKRKLRRAAGLQVKDYLRRHT